MIQTPHWLHIAPGTLFGQQGQDARVMTGFSGTLEIGRFIERDIDLVAHQPALAEQLQRQCLGGHGLSIIGDRHAIDADFTLFDQAAAPFAGTKSLRLQNAVQSQLLYRIRHTTNFSRTAPDRQARELRPVTSAGHPATANPCPVSACCQSPYYDRPSWLASRPGPPYRPVHQNSAACRVVLPRQH